MRNDLRTAINLFNEYKLNESRDLLEKIILNDENNEIAILTLAKIHSRTQNYGVALNLFTKVLELNKENSEAATGMQLIKNILHLSNNYYYENPYTDDEMYDL